MVATANCRIRRVKTIVDFLSIYYRHIRVVNGEIIIRRILITVRIWRVQSHWTSPIRLALDSDQ